MILNIRGGLGTQVLEMIVGLEKARIKNEQVDEICINIGGAVVSTVKHDYISELFSIPVPVTISDGILKQNAWTLENFELLSEFNYFDPRHGLRLQKPIESKTATDIGNILFHVRGKDRQVASVNDYKTLIEIFNYCNTDKISMELLGDDLDLIKKVNSNQRCKVIGGVSPIEDWIECISATTLISAFSSFTIAAALFNSKQFVRLISRTESNGPYKGLEDKHWQCLNILVNKRKDWEWL